MVEGIHSRRELPWIRHDGQYETWFPPSRLVYHDCGLFHDDDRSRLSSVEIGLPPRPPFSSLCSELCRGRGSRSGTDEEGRFQLPDPPDPVGQVLSLPRARCPEPQGRSSAGYEGGSLCGTQVWGTRDRPRSTRGE